MMAVYSFLLWMKKYVRTLQCISLINIIKLIVMLWIDVSACMRNLG